MSAIATNCQAHLVASLTVFPPRRTTFSNITHTTPFSACAQSKAGLALYYLWKFCS